MVDFLALDTETFDPNLLRLGPGTFRGDSYLLGFSWADNKGNAEYLNLGHKGITEEEKCRNWAKMESILRDPRPKVFANQSYDMDYFVNKHHLEVRGEIHDILHAESLLDEYRDSYSLDSIAKDYLGTAKEKGEIEGFCEANKLKGDPRKHLYLMPHALVEKYAKADATLLLPIIEKQLKKLESEELLPLYDMERGLFRPMLKMRANGMRVDENIRREVTDGHKRSLDRMLANWKRRFGDINFNSTKQLAHLFDEYEVPYDVSNGGKKALLALLGESADPKRLPMVDADLLFDRLGVGQKEAAEYRLANPSITALVLEAAAEEHPLATEVHDMKQLDKLIGTFLDGYLVEYAVNGVIHPTVSIYKSDEGGCVTGRMSSSKPNSQNFPAERGNFKPRMRDCIVADDGHWFGKIDYSSQENRVLAHYAQGPKADDIRAEYNANPRLDLHQVVADWTGIERKISKRITFGISYGMGPSSLGKKNLWSADYAMQIYSQYVDMVPFVLTTRDKVGQKARDRGWIKTILGRRCRCPKSFHRKQYLFLNRLIQGSAADMTKKAVADCDKAGLFDVLKLSVLVHDEIDVQVPKTREGLEAFREMQHLMENAVKLKVPVLAEAELGASWGTVDKFDWEQKEAEL